jgi:hypothetical protein
MIPLQSGVRVWLATGHTARSMTTSICGPMTAHWNESITRFMHHCAAEGLPMDWENLNRKALAFLRLASIRLMLRKLCNPA